MHNAREPYLIAELLRVRLSVAFILILVHDPGLRRGDVLVHDRALGGCSRPCPQSENRTNSTAGIVRCKSMRSRV
jgi:hypothetical protein